MRKVLPGSEITNIKVAYLVNAVIHGWFTAAIWLFFFQDTVSNTEIGVIFVVSLAVLVASELPSGILSDLIGHKRVLVLAALLSSVGTVVSALNTGFWSLLISLAVFFLGSSFYSGARDAFAFESFKEAGKEDLYDAYLGAETRLGNISKVVCTLIGALIFQIERGLPYFALGLTHLVAAVALVVWASEPEKVAAVDKGENELSWFGELGQTVRSPQWIPVALLGTVVAALSVVVGWGPFEIAIATESGFTEDNLFWLLAPVFIFQAIAGGYFPKVLNWVGGSIKGLYVSSLILVGIYVILGFGTIFTLALGFVVIRTLGDYFRAFVLSYMQERLSPDVRASALSVVSLLRWTVIAAAALISGIAADNGWILQLSFIFAVLVFALVITQRALTAIFSRQINLSETEAVV